MKYKEFSVKYDDAGNGSIEGYASTWIKTPDSYGDVVRSGAFARTLKERWNGGKGIPLLWAHKMNELDAFIGTADAEEDEKGLHFVASFDGTDEAQRVRDLYRDGRLSKFSFAYDIFEDGMVTLEGGEKAHELRDLELYEISCVCVPANDDAGVVAVKSTELETKDAEPKEAYIQLTPEMVEAALEKSGRRNSKADADKLEQAIALIQDVLGQIDDIEEEPEPEDGEDEEKANVATEEPEQSNPKKDALLEVIAKIREEE